MENYKMVQVLNKNLNIVGDKYGLIRLTRNAIPKL